jgi:serine/threonine protein kinase
LQSVGGQVRNFLAPPQAVDEIGRLGGYHILKVLGQGGMGVVFRAEDVSLKRVVALKAMLPSLAASPSAKKRFLREAQTGASWPGIGSGFILCRDPARFKPELRLLREQLRQR